MAVYDTGSNYQFYDKNVVKHPARSRFNLNHLYSTSMFFGENVPIYWNYTLPDSDYNVSVENLTRVQGLEVPLMSRMRLILHGYHMPLSVLWKGAHNFYNTAMNLYLSGTSMKSLFQNPTMPRFKTSSSSLVTNHSLANYLGLPVGFDLQDTNDVFISALPFMAYSLIQKSFETKRYLMNATQQKLWFTQDESAWRLPASGFVGSSFENPEFIGSSINLNQLYNRYYADDYFSSARPSPQAGDPPTISLAVTGLTGSADLGYGVFGYDNTVSPFISGNLSLDSTSFQTSVPKTDSVALKFVSHSASSPNRDYSTLEARLNNDIPNDSVSGHLYNVLDGSHLFPISIDGSQASVGLTLNQLRELDSATAELERMNRLDGSYTEFIQAFFGNKPSHADKFRPRYFGGAYAPIVVSEVLQTSSTDSEPTPLGSSAGHGISSSSSRLGSFHSDDFGLMMITASYIPDVMYHQGIDKKFSLQFQEEFPLPTRVGLGPEPIYNKELYFDTPRVNDLFAYQDRYDSWRYEQNKVTGYLSDSSQLSYYPYTQVREFNSLPTFSDSTFRLSQQNINLSAFMAPEEPPFISQFAIKIGAVLPLPYRGIPDNLFSSSRG